MSHIWLACLLWWNRCHQYVPSHEFFTLTLKVCRKQSRAPIGRSSNCLTFQLGCSRSMDVAAATLLKFWDKCHVMRIDWNMKMVRDGCRAPCTVSFAVVVIFQPNGGAVFLIWPCAMVCVSYGHWWEKFTLMTDTSVWVTLPSVFYAFRESGTAREGRGRWAKYVDTDGIVCTHAERFVMAFSRGRRAFRCSHLKSTFI